jgi:hypothetical protein
MRISRLKGTGAPCRRIWTAFITVATISFAAGAARAEPPPSQQKYAYCQLYMWSSDNDPLELKTTGVFPASPTQGDQFVKYLAEQGIVVSNYGQNRVACFEYPSRQAAQSSRDENLASETYRTFRQTDLSWTPRAEAPHGELKYATINFLDRTHSNDRNGYDSASIRLAYRFVNCGGEIHMAYGLDKKSLRLSATYGVGGKRVSAEGVRPPDINVLHIRGPVKRRMNPVPVHHFEDEDAGEALGFGCFTGQTQKVGTVAALVGPKAKPEEIQALLDELALDGVFLKRPRHLRNALFEGRAPDADVPGAPPQNDRAEDDAKVRDINAQLAREVAARNAADVKAKADYQAAVAKHAADVAAIEARNQARQAEYQRQKAAADAARAAYDAQWRTPR